MKNPFNSALKSELRAFLDYKRALGFRYARPEGTLRHFDRHVSKIHRSEDREPDLRSLVQSWLEEGQGRKSITAATELGVIRQFCLYRRRSDPDGFVPGREWFPRCLESQFIPYIFPEAEVRSILQQASRGPKTLGSHLVICHLSFLIWTVEIEPGPVDPEVAGRFAGVARTAQPFCLPPRPVPNDKIRPQCFPGSK